MPALDFEFGGSKVKVVGLNGISSYDDGTDTITDSTVDLPGNLTTQR